jgi:hypothetical protein
MHFPEKLETVSSLLGAGCGADAMPVANEPFSRRRCSRAFLRCRSLGMDNAIAFSPSRRPRYSFARPCLENAPWSVPSALECNSAPPITRLQPVRLTAASRYRTRSSNPVCAVRFLRHGRAKECRRRLNDKILLFGADFRLNRRTTPSNVATDSEIPCSRSMAVFIKPAPRLASQTAGFHQFDQ